MIDKKSRFITRKFYQKCVKSQIVSKTKMFHMEHHYTSPALLSLWSRNDGGKHERR